MAELAQIGVTGLAMGRNLARNFVRHGHSVAIHNRSYAKTESLLAEAGSEGTFIHRNPWPISSPRWSPSPGIDHGQGRCGD